MSVGEDVPFSHGILDVIVAHDLLFGKDLHRVQLFVILLDEVDFSKASFSEHLNWHELLRFYFFRRCLLVGHNWDTLSIVVALQGPRWLRLVLFLDVVYSHDLYSNNRAVRGCYFIFVFFLTLKWELMWSSHLGSHLILRACSLTLDRCLNHVSYDPLTNVAILLSLGHLNCLVRYLPSWIIRIQYGIRLLSMAHPSLVWVLRQSSFQ